MNIYNHIYITGDTHGDFSDLVRDSARKGITENDLLIILGDAGLNYDNGEYDIQARKELSVVSADVLCIRGNHERRPNSPDIRWKYEMKSWMGGNVFVQSAYPRILFAPDGSRYSLNGREFLVIGGAYSVDKPYRLAHGYSWFPDEQLTDSEKKAITENVTSHGNHEDIILSHTCPYNYQPLDCFLPGIDQRHVDKSTESFLQYILDSLEDSYSALYCGHWHIDRNVGKVHFLFHRITKLC